MDLGRLLEELARPAAYPFAVTEVEVRQTHISAVFLAGDFAYKVKKPVNPGFLDFSSLEKRRHFCDEEVRLNRRLAPQIYLGVVPIVQAPAGARFEGEGEVIEWAVKMQRLPEEATLHRRLLQGEDGAACIEALAGKIAAFHQTAQANDRIAAFGCFPAVARLIRDIFDQPGPRVGTTVSQAVFDRLRDLLEKSLAQLRPLIEARAARGVPRDAHGDLHLDHIYYFPDREPPADLVIVDCIEFNERFRFIDPVADMAFAHMDLAFHGRPDLARAFADAYFRACGSEEGRPLLPLYSAYRATVRGAMEGLLLGEEEVPEAERVAALARARAHWLLALEELEEPDRKPCLMLIGGLPGTGKSTLARSLAERPGFALVRSDAVRKELAGLPGTGTAPGTSQQNLYTAEWDRRTYAECLHWAEELLFEGKRVLVDATFRQESERRTFLAAAESWRVPGVLLICQAEAETVRQRLADRRGDASEADWAVYQMAAADWQPASAYTGRALHEISTEGSSEEVLARALNVLRAVNLCS